MGRRSLLYQIINLDRREVIFGTTERNLDDEVVRVARDPKSPVRQWRKGERVQWRALSSALDSRVARQLHRDMESHGSTENFTVIPTFEPVEDDETFYPIEDPVARGKPDKS
jgi:hypothetical protein